MLTNNDFSVILTGSAPNYTAHPSSLTDTGQVGLNLNNQNKYDISSLVFTNIAGEAVNVDNSAGGWQHVGYLSKLSISHSYIGLKLNAAAEYETVSDCNVSNCVFGYLVDGGNNSFNNCKATYCSIGAKITGVSANNGHGVWVGLIANHCYYNLVCQDVTLGEHFIGCCFIAGQSGSNQGKIQLLNSRGITFTGGQIGFIDMTLDATCQVALHGVTFRGTVNITTVAGAVLDAKDNIVMAGAVVKLNGAVWSGNN